MSVHDPTLETLVTDGPGARCDPDGGCGGSCGGGSSNPSGFECRCCCRPAASDSLEHLWPDRKTDVTEMGGGAGVGSSFDLRFGGTDGVVVAAVAMDAMLAIGDSFLE